MEVKRICNADLEILREWFRDDVLAVYLGGMLPLEQWYKVVGTEGRHVWLTYAGQTPVGMVDVQVDGKQAYISVAVNPSHRRKGYGRESVNCILKQQELSKVHKIIAGIPRSNTASIKCFESCGFTHQGVDEDGCLLYIKSLNPRSEIIDKPL